MHLFVCSYNNVYFVRFFPGFFAGFIYRTKNVDLPRSSHTMCVGISLVLIVTLAAKLDSVNQNKHNSTAYMNMSVYKRDYICVSALSTYVFMSV